jgi:hypothetical protein
MHLEPLIDVLIEKLAQLSQERRATLTQAENAERLLATRIGQAAGAALGSRGARDSARKAVKALGASGRVLTKSRAKGVGNAVKAVSILSGSIAGSGLASRKGTERVQRIRRDRMEGVPAKTLKQHAVAAASVAKTEAKQVAELPKKYRELSDGATSLPGTYVKLHKRG